MANKTIEDLTAKTASATGDYFVFRRPTDSASDKDHKLLRENMISEFSDYTIDNYRIRIASKNISAANQDNDISGYESSTYDGKIIEIGATGGTGTYTCTITTGTYTIGEIAASNWYWDGKGRLRLLVDVSNTNFIPIGPWCWDRDGGQFTSTHDLVTWGKFLDGTLNISYIDENTRTIATAATNMYLDIASRQYTYPIAFYTGTIPVISDAPERVAGQVFQMKDTGITNTYVYLRMASHSNTSTGKNGYIANGLWTSQANANAIVYG